MSLERAKVRRKEQKKAYDKVFEELKVISQGLLGELANL
jgi:hypothetical protein